MRQYAEIEDELAMLPEPLPNALHAVKQAVTDLAPALRSKIESLEPNDLTESWKKIKDDFHKSIVNRQRPRLIVTSPATESGKQHFLSGRQCFTR